MSMTTKAGLLRRAKTMLHSARILPLETFTVADWLDDGRQIVERVQAHGWAAGPLIVRSSAVCEGRVGASQAGRYASVLEVLGPDQFACAVEAVRRSYEAAAPLDEIFVQPMLDHAQASGVATSVDPSGGGRYRIVTWAEGRATDAVTAGRVDGLRSWRGTEPAPGWNDHPVVGRVLPCLREIEERFGFTAVEIEFGIDADGALVLFQMRELDAGAVVARPAFQQALETTVAQVDACAARDHRVLGSGILLGAMTDWNPAELIGLRPTPLARSLYDRVIASAAWSVRRADYGYRDMRGVALMVDVAGYAFIDVRRSLTSFVPAGLPDDLSGRLVEAYLERLRRVPTLHDKVEFEVAVTCMAFDTAARLSAYVGQGLEQADVAPIEAGLRAITDRLCRVELIESEMCLLEQLGRSREEAAPLALLQHASRLWNDARDLGAIPFAGIARCSFVATELLRSAAAAGIIGEDDVASFFGGLSLPSSTMGQDLVAMSRPQFLARYGHLRPGTYDIRAPRYDEAFDHYFTGTQTAGAPRAGGADATPVSNSPRSMAQAARAALDRGLLSLGLTVGVSEFLEAARCAIEAREWAKFDFTRNVSDALQVLTRWGEAHSLAPDDLAWLTCAEIEGAAGLPDWQAIAHIHACIVAAKRAAEGLRGIELPVLLRSRADCLAWEAVEGLPNFVTQGRVTARLADVDADEDPAGAIVAVQHADPGYDWIFARGIAGLITAFGGVNSHMAVRALEAGIPAAIGCGPLHYKRLVRFRVVELDAGSRLVRGVA